MSNEARRAAADVVIDNSGGAETLLARIDREWLRVIGNDGRQPREQDSRRKGWHAG
jgi:dephospho-CoA kinase